MKPAKSANGSGEQLVPAIPVTTIRINPFTTTTGTGAGSPIFRRKTERLDWRQIASIDIHSLLHSASEDELKTLLVHQLLPQVTYCSIEDELLERDKLDPGFVKVFQIAQLLIEFLLHQHHIAFGAEQRLEVECGKLIEENDKQRKLVMTLKEALIEAKKELRRRKDGFITSQNEVVGVGNKDEYDKCPYCTKQFISPIYLLSHLQRRHQGLPLLFTKPSTKIEPQQHHPNQMQKLSHDTTTQTKPIVEQVTMSTQTPPDESGLGLEEVKVKVAEDKFVENESQANAKVESGLQEPLEHQEVTMKKIIESESQTKTESELQKLVAQTEELEARIKREIDTCWTQLASKLQETGIEEFRRDFMDEIEKLKDMITSSSHVQIAENTDDGREETLAGERLSMHDLEERFLKQEQELESLKTSMQSKMQEDIVAFDNKLQAQEQFWSTKLRQVEEQYENQATRLKEEIQATMVARASSKTWRDEEIQTTEEVRVVPEQKHVRSQTTFPNDTSTNSKKAHEAFTMSTQTLFDEEDLYTDDEDEEEEEDQEEKLVHRNVQQQQSESEPEESDERRIYNPFKKFDAQPAPQVQLPLRTIHEEMLEAEQKRKEKKKSFFSRTKAKLFSWKPENVARLLTGIPPAKKVVRTESRESVKVSDENMKQDLQDDDDDELKDDEEEDDLSYEESEEEVQNDLEDDKRENGESEESEEEVVQVDMEDDKQEKENDELNDEVEKAEIETKNLQKQEENNDDEEDGWESSLSTEYDDEIAWTSPKGGQKDEIKPGTLKPLAVSSPTRPKSSYYYRR